MWESEERRSVCNGIQVTQKKQRSCKKPLAKKDFTYHNTPHRIIEILKKFRCCSGPGKDGKEELCL